MRFPMVKLPAVVALVLVGALGATGGASAATLAWNTPTIYQEFSSGTSKIFISLSCSSMGNCVGVGEASDPSSTEPVIAVESNGTWGATVSPVLPSDHSTTAGTPVLGSVSCSSASSCEAVGYYETTGSVDAAMVVPITVSGATVTSDTAAELPLPSGATNAWLNGVSCNSTGCTAVGYTDLGPLVATNAGGN